MLSATPTIKWACSLLQTYLVGKSKLEDDNRDKIVFFAVRTCGLPQIEPGLMRNTSVSPGERVEFKCQVERKHKDKDREKDKEKDKNKDKRKDKD